MSNVPVKFASMFFLGAAAGAVWTMFPQRAVLAADNCVTVPTDQTPQGQHWYYHIERGTGRHCWYLRGGDDKSARTETPATAAPEPSAPRRAEAPPSRSIADAHAEIPLRARVPGEAPAANSPAANSSVWPSPASAPPPAGAAQAPNEPTPSLASRWPQTSGASVAGTSGAAPAPDQPAADQQQPQMSLMLADVQTADATTDAANGAQAAPPAMPERNMGSIQKLLAVAAGALALAGLTGSAVYRLGRRRRRNDWLRERTAWKSAQNPNTPPWLEPRFASANAIPDLDEARLAAEQSDFSLAMSERDQVMSERDQSATNQTDRMTARGSDQARDSDQIAANVEKIEDFLARLTRQLEHEVKSSNAKRAEPDGRRVTMVDPHREEARAAGQAGR